MGKYLRHILVLILLIFCATGADAARRKRQPVDTLGLGCRGVMESFARVSDGLERRLDFYASKGYTHYFYCPSDDRYCNRWGWKFLYSDSGRFELKKINALCKEKGLELVWTLDPGELYGWTPEDYDYLLNKLVIMYYNGIRSFAVSFSSNQGDHAAVRDSLMRDFVASRREKVSLFMIDDMSVAEYPSEGAESVKSLMRGYHFDESFISNARKHDCVICNMTSSDEFSKLAVLSVADFASDPKSYSADDAMADAVEALHGDVKDAFITFLHHTGDVDESTDVDVFRLDEWTRGRSDSLYVEFCRIEAVPQRIRSNVSSDIFDALEPWLVEFGRLGTRGKKVLECMNHYKAGDLESFWREYISTVMTAAERSSYEKYPVGAGKLHPFCIDAMEAMREGFASMLTEKTVLHNLAPTLFSELNEALDSDLTTCMDSDGHIEFAIPADANTCHLLTGRIPQGKHVIFRQLRTDGSLVAEFVVKSSYSTFDLKDGAVKVDVLGEVAVYENIFVYL